jgi:ABC-type thiamin/hydroxymethylpyrimidine transport system permease subunit
MSDKLTQNVTQQWSGQPLWRHPRSIITCGVLGATLFALNLVIGGALVYATGIPGLSAILSGLFVPFVLSLAVLITRRSGAATTVWLVYSLLAIPTVLNGPPGVYKVVIGLVAGLAFDLPIIVLRGRAVGHYIGLIAYTVINLAAFWLAFILLSLPGREAFQKAVFVIAAIFFVEGSVSVTLALLWYRRRLSRMSFAHRFAE